MHHRLRLIALLGLILIAAAIPQLGFAQAEGATQIQLRSATFDPLTQQPDTRGAIPAPSGSTMYLIQFTGPVLDEWKTEVTNAGAQLYGYIPDYAFIARMNEATAATLRSSPIVRWVGLYEPTYRLEPSLLARTRSAVNQPTTVTAQTLPDVALDGIIKEIEAWGGVVQGQASNAFGGSLEITLSSDRLGQLAALEGVVWVEPYVAHELQNDAGGGDIMRANSVRQSLGLYGAGQIVAVADTGLDVGNATNLHPDLRGRLVQAYCLGRPSPCDWSDPNGHGTHVSGSVLGNGTQSGSNPATHQYAGSYAGNAPEARLVFQSIMAADGSLNGIPDDTGDLMRQAYAQGARIHTNSWGAAVDGVYTTDSQEVDQVAWEQKDLLILFAAANDGEDANNDGVVDADSMGAPATAKNALTVGASENNRPDISDTWGSWWPDDFGTNPVSGDPMANNANGMAAFSSRGPTDDGRIKPDVAAPGTFIISTRSQDPNVGDAWGAVNTHYHYMGGTSMATPLTAGAAALVREWYTRIQNVATPSAALLKATMLNGAVDMGVGQYGTGATQEIPSSRPNNVSGWGRVDLANSLTPVAPRKVWFTDNTQGLATGNVAEYTVSVSAPAPAAQFVQNGGMEADANWTLTAASYNSTEKQAGSRSIAFTAQQNGQISQNIAIPANTREAVLTYHWKNISPDVGWSTIYDSLKVGIYNSTGATALCGDFPLHGDSKGQWQQETFALDAACLQQISGQTVQLRFTFAQDNVTPHSVFYVDSVSLGPLNPEPNTARFTLAWTDYPAQASAARALVNNLDLEVIAPNGTSYKGNQGIYAAGHACLRTGGWDQCNNVEGIILPNAAAGTYRIRVHGIQVPQGTRQPFAVVGSGNNMQTATTPAPGITLNPTSLTFASQAVGSTSAAKPVTLTNSGTGALSITSIAASGDFQQTNTCGTSVAAGASCTLQVTFRPTVAGNRTGAVTITSNAVGSPHTVSLTGTGTSTTPPTARPQTDFNGDGKADILWRHATSGQNLLYHMDGLRVISKPVINTLDTNWKVAGVADFGGDGKADILWRHATTGVNFLYQMDGRTIVSSGTINTVSDANWKIVGVGDFTGDRKADILWRHATSGQNLLYQMDGQRVISNRVVNTLADLNWKVMGVADFTGDGKADILWRHATTGQNVLYQMDGRTIVASGTINTVSDLGWKIVGVGDFGGDGKADILWRHATLGQNLLYQMDGLRVISKTVINTLADLNWKVAGVADFGGDGKSDILWRHATTGQNVLYQMNGRTIVTSGTINTVADMGWKVVGYGINPEYAAPTSTGPETVTIASDAGQEAGLTGEDQGVPADQQPGAAPANDDTMPAGEARSPEDQGVPAEQVAASNGPSGEVDPLPSPPDDDQGVPPAQQEGGAEEPTSITLTRFDAQPTAPRWLVPAALLLAGLISLTLRHYHRS